MLSHKERLTRTIRGDEVDRIPMVGGWNLGVRNVAELAGISLSEYLCDPGVGVIRANQRLGVEAIVSHHIVPTDIDAIRDGSLQEGDFAEVEPEVLKERADAIPEGEAEVVKAFDALKAEQKFRACWEPRLKQADGLELLPTFWGATANFALYFQYGYEAFLAAVALYPEEIGKTFWEDGIRAREENKVLVKLMKEWDLIPLMFCGNDICVNRGPMVNPEFLRQYYWPNVKVGLAPYLEADIRVIHHCDGDVMLLVDDMIGAGFSGFQGFQYECGVDPYELRIRRSLKGEVPLLLGGLSVTRTLPAGTPQEVIEDVEYILDATEGGRGLMLFTSNVTGVEVEVPPANIVAAYKHLADYDPGKPRTGSGSRCLWPWKVAHPED